MKETTRLPDPSINDCLSPTFQYSLLQAHTYNYTVTYNCGESDCTQTCTAAYPEEWNSRGGICSLVTRTPSPRLTCLTNHFAGPTSVSVV